MATTHDLTAPPPNLTANRLALHRLATYVIAPARHVESERFGLRATRGGFGTPPFGAARRIRVEGNELIDEREGVETRARITSLAAAAEFLGTSIDAETAAEHDSPELGDIDADLAVDAAASRFLGTWFNMAFEALDRVRAHSDAVDATQPQLWPGHFDPAIEMGDEDHRASYGASPGDHAIDEPYLYVSVWWPDRLGLDSSDPVWNAQAFTGAVLRLSDFGSGDPVEVAAAFWNTCRTKLDAAELT